MKKFILGIALALGITSASAQSVQQSGSVTPNTVAVWNSTGVVKGGATAIDSPVTNFGVTRDAQEGICVSSARQSAAGRNQLCLVAATSGPAKITLQNYGSALAQDLQFVMNGTVLTLPSGGGTVITGTAPFSINGIPVFSAITGNVVDSGLDAIGGAVTVGAWQATPVAVAFGGTGATSTTDARTNLGLGSMATQAASSVAITGGAITGMSSPTVASDVATKSYVDSVATGLHILAASRLATAAVLPNTPSYSNGASGVGATLTAGSNSTLTVDGTTANLNDVVLVKTQASAFQNGIYTVTQAGSGGTPWILTRATYFDTAAEMLAGSYTLVTAGSTNANTSYVLQSTVTTVGTTAADFVLFSSSTAGVTSIAGNTGAFTLSTGLTNSGNALLNDGVLTVGGTKGVITLGGTLSIGGGILRDNVREQLTGARTYYARSDGSNSTCNGMTDASSASAPNCAFLTVNNALAVASTLDQANFAVTVKICGPSYPLTTTENIAIAQTTTYTGAIVIAGCTGTTTDVVSHPSSGNNIDIEGNNLVYVQAVSIWPATGGLGIAAVLNARVYASNILYTGSGSGGPTYQNYASRGGYLDLSGPIVVLGSGADYWLGSSHRGEIRLNAATVAFGTNIPYTIVAYALGKAEIVVTNGSTITGSATGTRYFADNGYILWSGGTSTSFPGSVAGVIANFGVYEN